MPSMVSAATPNNNNNNNYQFKKKNDVCFDVRGCVIEIWKRSFPQHAQHAILGAQLPWLSNVRKTK